MIFPVSSVDSILFKPVNEDSIKGPKITTLKAEYEQYYVVTLFGSISGLEAAALDFQCGFEYSTDDAFSKENTRTTVAARDYSEDTFSSTLEDIIPGQKYFYRAYYIWLM